VVLSPPGPLELGVVALTGVALRQSAAFADIKAAAGNAPALAVG
jgi:hypothetical protein